MTSAGTRGLHVCSRPHYPNSGNSPTWQQALTSKLEKTQIPCPAALTYKCLFAHVPFFCCGFTGITDHLRHDTLHVCFRKPCHLPTPGYVKGRVLSNHMFSSGTCHAAVQAKITESSRTPWCTRIRLYANSEGLGAHAGVVIFPLQELVL